MSVPTVDWMKQNNTFNTSRGDDQVSINYDNAGNVYAVYRTGGFLNYPGNTDTSGTDIAVVKFNNLGVVQWARQLATYNTNGSDANPVVAIKRDVGDLYVAYQTNGTIQGGTSSGSNDIVVFKLDTNGVQQWANQLANFNTSASDTFPDIDIDSVGNVYVAFYTTGAVPGKSNSGNEDIVLFKLDATGAFQWSIQNNTYNTANSDVSPSVRVNRLDQVVMAYTTGGSLTGQQDSGGNDICVTKFDNNGNIIWQRKRTDFNTSLNDNNPRLDIDFYNNVYVAYSTTGTSSGNTNTGGQDIVIFKLDNAGTHQWTRQSSLFNTNVSDSRPDMYVDDDGGCYVAYLTLGQVAGQTSSGGFDLVVFKLDNTGTHMWSYQQATNNSLDMDIAPSICVDNTCHIYVAVQTDNVLPWPGTSLTGSFDIGLIKLHQSISGTCGDPHIITIKENRKYTLPNVDGSTWRLLEYIDSGCKRLVVNASIKYHDDLPNKLYHGMQLRNKSALRWLNDHPYFYDKLYIKYDNNTIVFDIDNHVIESSNASFNRFNITQERRAYRSCLYTTREYPMTEKSQYTSIKINLSGKEYIELAIYTDINADDRSSITIGRNNIMINKLRGIFYTADDIKQLRGLYDDKIINSDILN